MAIESQGIKIRRVSTAAGSSALSTGFTIIVDEATGIRRTAGDFVADGFSTGMRVEFTETTYNRGPFTVKSVAATAMAFYETLSTHSTGIHETVEGHTFQNIGSVVGFNGPSGSAAVIDITTLDSTAKEKMIGIRDEGQVSMDLLFDTNSSSLQTALIQDRADRTLRKFDIKFTDQSTVADAQPSYAYFSGYVQGFTINGSVDNAVKASATLELTSSVYYRQKVG